MNSKIKNVLFYAEDIAQIEYNADHPFKPHRAKIFLELLKRYNLIFEDDQKIITPSKIDESFLNLGHDQNYLLALKDSSAGKFKADFIKYGLGTSDNPIFEGLYEFSWIATSATYQGAQLLAEDKARFIFNPHGGFHHAGFKQAEGFCYINDIVIAIKSLVARGKRVAYLDIDVHHGNGVQDAFYETDKVLTISIHESGRTLYPGSGFENEIGLGAGEGYNINIPLEAGTDDEVYLYAFKKIVPSLIEKFKPDFIFFELGADAHKDDPLANLNLTSNGYQEVVEIVNKIAPKILVTTGGGYNVDKTVSLWTLAWSIFCDLKPEDHYAGSVGGMMYGDEKSLGSLYDPPFKTHGYKKEKCLNEAERVVSFLEKLIFF